MDEHSKTVRIGGKPSSSGRIAQLDMETVSMPPLRKHRQLGGREAAVTREEVGLERPEWQDHFDLWDEVWEQRGPANRLVLMVKDPWTMFAYWWLSSFQKEQVSQHFESPWEELSFSLRLMDVTDLNDNGEQAHRCRIEDTHPLADRYWFPQVEPDRHYLVEWGTWTVEGRFFSLLRSNVVKTPPQAVKQQPSSLKMKQISTLSRVSTPVPGEPYYPEIREDWMDPFDGYTWVEKKGEG